MIAYTQFHLRLFAEELTQRFASSDFERLAGALVDAQVDLNPHQVDAALFAFHSPLSKGAILTDEVGLGKTIEAGLVIAQKWAERKRRILVITPANLRKQWFQELTEKFFLPCKKLSGNCLGGQSPDHKPNHCRVDQGFCGLRKEFVVAVKSAVEGEPGEGRLHYPTSGNDQKTAMASGLLA